MPDEPEKDDILLPHVNVFYAAAILQAISGYAEIEYQIDELIWELAVLEPEIGACLTAQIVSIAPRMDALITLAHAQYASEQSLTKLRKFKEVVGGLGTRRHRLAHDPWYSTFKTDRLYRLEKTARGKLIHNYQPVTDEELALLADDIKRAANTFSEIRSEILAAFRASPYRPPRFP